jgi:sugar-specific transcriptional regulator TrmB
VNENDVVMSDLRTLGLRTREATIYLELSHKPATHAALSLATGINRTTLYRMVSSLEKRGLITQTFDGTGKLLVAADPSTLEVEVVDQEQRAKQQRTALGKVLPTLETIRQGHNSADFTIQTYEGTEGFKRMLWHELKAEGECLCITLGTLEDLVLDHRWAERHRQKTIDAGYAVREIANSEDFSMDFTQNALFLERTYRVRVLPRQLFPVGHLTAIYNNTVAIYNVHQGGRVGLEIISKTYAETMRTVFNHYWDLASEHA